ncbi:MAG: hypothetical protein QM754_16840 [Tepidisphaeraceae bacterium]
MRIRPGRVRLAAAVAVLTSVAAARADLRADELLLLVNSKVPQSLALAEQYAKARGVPAERILKLDTETGEDLTFDQYNATIAKPVRDYLATPAGKGVRCLVTFFGLPLRVGAQPANPADQQELQRLRKAMADLDAAAPKLAQTMDDAAKSVGVTPPETRPTNVWSARQHIAETQRRVQAMLTSSPDLTKQAAIVEKFKAAQQQSNETALACSARRRRHSRRICPPSSPGNATPTPGNRSGRASPSRPACSRSTRCWNSRFCSSTRPTRTPRWTVSLRWFACPISRGTAGRSIR